MSELPELLENVFTPETPEDAEGGPELGQVSIFGHTLTADECEAFAAAMLAHAATARAAAQTSSPDPVTGKGPGGLWE